MAARSHGKWNTGAFMSEKEKKEIFMPGATWGRNLRIGEKPFVELGNEHKSSRTRKSELLLHSSIGDEYQ